MIKAVKGKLTREFSPEGWRKLPLHKYGWEQVSTTGQKVSKDIPEEIILKTTKKKDVKDVVDSNGVPGLEDKA